jgi:hypothetical protein
MYDTINSDATIKYVMLHHVTNWSKGGERCSLWVRADSDIIQQEKFWIAVFSLGPTPRLFHEDQRDKPASFRRETTKFSAYKWIWNVSATVSLSLISCWKWWLARYCWHKNVRLTEIIVSDILDSGHLPTVLHLLDHSQIGSDFKARPLN